MSRRPLLPLAGGLLLAAGCGSAGVRGLPPAAEPRVAPPLAHAPAGRVVRLGPPVAALSAGRTASPGGAPEGMVVDPASGVVAVAVRRPPQLVLVDGASARVRVRVGLPGGPRHLALDAATGDVLVPAETANRYERVRPRDGRVLAETRVGAYPHDLAAVAGGRVLVGDERGNALSVVRRGDPVRTVAMAAQPGGVVAIQDGAAAAVISVRERVVERYDARTLRRTARVPAGVGPTHGVSLGALLWVTDTQGDALLVYRLTGGHLTLTRRVHLPGGPYGIALDTRRRRLWVTLTGRNEVAELPASGRPHLLRTLATVRQPNTVAVSPSSGRVFVGGRADGVLQLIDP